jgi:hypothetical protein
VSINIDKQVPSSCSWTRWFSHILSYRVFDIKNFYFFSLVDLSSLVSTVLFFFGASSFAASTTFSFGSTVLTDTSTPIFFLIFSAILADLPFLSLK